MPSALWALQGSNLRPLGCDPNALPTELNAQRALGCLGILAFPVLPFKKQLQLCLKLGVFQHIGQTFALALARNFHQT